MQTRRFFIGGLASCFALGPSRIFAATKQVLPSGKPSLVFGVVSDIHISLAAGGKSIIPAYNTEIFKATLSRFRDANVDAVVIAGDMAHLGLGPELVEVGKAWSEIFPGNRAPDGRRVEPVFVTGNHDTGKNRGKRAYGKDKKAIAENTICNDPAKWWDLAFHEEWQSIFRKNVKGYTFVGAQWSAYGCRENNAPFNPEIPDWYAKNGKSIDPSLPFFHVQHPHPKGTVHGDKVWGQDSALSTNALSAFPNAVAFSGHSHISLTDERSIWQGAFTSVGCASLRNVSIGVPGVKIHGGSFENGRAKKAELDAIKAMPEIDRFECKQEQIVRVYPDCMTFSRREAISGESYGPDLVMPLPAAEKRPFDHKLRFAKAMAPEFPNGAKLEIGKKDGKLRGKKKVKVWEIVIPPANALRNTRPAMYEIEIAAEGGFSLTRAVCNPGARFPETDARANRPVNFRIDASRIPAESFTVRVTAISYWNRRSAPLEGKA